MLISGQNLGNASSVQFGTNNALNFFSASTNVISVFSPPNATPAPVHVTVTAPAGSSSPTSADLFTYTPTPAPVVSVISPATGPAEGNTTVFITGQNLGNPTGVTFGGTGAFGFFSLAANLVEAGSPLISAATYPDPVDVIVTTPSGSSASTTNDTFTYTATPAPTITGVSPSTGPAGTTVWISGADLSGLSGLSFGPNPVSGPAATPSLGVLRVTSPTGTPTSPPSPVDIRVTTAGGLTPVTAADQYTYTAEDAPAITAISPNSGAAGSMVSITGEHLAGATAVSFGTTAAPNFVARSDNLIRVPSPAGSGAVHVRVTTTAGMVTPATAADLYFYPGAGPVVMAALPAMANTAYGGYTTVAYIKNVGTAPASISISYYNTDGVSVGVGDVNPGLPVNATWIVLQNNGNSLPSGSAGSGLISSNQPIAAFVNESAPPNPSAPGSTTDASSYSAIPVPDGTGPTLYAPAILNGAYGGYTTGVDIVNAGNAATDITITYRGANGTTQTSAELPGRRRPRVSGRLQWQRQSARRLCRDRDDQ